MLRQLITQLSQLGDNPLQINSPVVSGVSLGAQAQQGTTSSSSDATKAARQQAAANARAAKAAMTNANKPAAQQQQQQLNATPQLDLGTGTNGAGDQAGGDDDDDMGLGENASSMSPAEARDAGLALVREVYSAGHVAEVKSLQKTLNVAKFYDVPVDSGHAFYARVMKLAQGVGLRQ